MGQPDHVSLHERSIFMMEHLDANYKATIVAQYNRPADSPWSRLPEPLLVPKPQPKPQKEPWEKTKGVTATEFAPELEPDRKRYRATIPMTDFWWQVGPRTETKNQRERPPNEPPTRPKPPDPRTKERKITINGQSGPMRLVGAVTEGLDLLDCMWGALPDSAKTKPWEGEGTKADTLKGHVDPKTGKLKKPHKSSRKITPQQKMRDLYENFGSMDIGKALTCIGLNEIEDRAIGWNGKQWSKFAREHGVRGFMIGPAM